MNQPTTASPVYNLFSGVLTAAIILAWLISLVLTFIAVVFGWILLAISAGGAL